MNMPDGLFQCPTCHQVYEVSRDRIKLIRDHMAKHGQEVDSRWIRRRTEKMSGSNSGTG